MNELINMCHEYKELQRLAEALAAEMDAMKERIRSAMDGAESVTAGEYKISDKLVTSSRIDTTALKKALPDIAAQFAKSTTARRFSIS